MSNTQNYKVGDIVYVNYNCVNKLVNEKATILDIQEFDKIVIITQNGVTHGVNRKHLSKQPIKS